MTDRSELNSRAALCRKLAQLEPANRMFWLAEAENWSRLAKEQRHDDGTVRTGSRCGRADFDSRGKACAAGQNRDAV